MIWFSISWPGEGNAAQSAGSAARLMNVVLIQAYSKKSLDFGLTPYIHKVEIQLSFGMPHLQLFNRIAWRLAVHTGFDQP